MQEKRILKRWKVLGLCFVFILPMIAAVGVYSFRHLFDFSLKVNGSLLTPPIRMETLGLNDSERYSTSYQTDPIINPDSPHWQLVYFLPPNCNADCQHKMQLLKNLNTALGKDKDRVILRCITTKTLRPGTQQTAHAFAPETILIIDPKGWVMMQYPENNFNAKGILQDLGRLLRYSHVG